MSLKLVNSCRGTHTTTPAAVAAAPAGAAAAADAPQDSPTSDSPADSTQEQPLVESIADIGQDKGPSKSGRGEDGSDGSVRADAKVLLRRAQGKGVNPGSFLGLMLGTKDSSTGKPFADDVVSSDEL